MNTLSTSHSSAMESLRETLIREGSITPGSTDGVINKCIDVLEHFYQVIRRDGDLVSFNKKIISRYTRAIFSSTNEPGFVKACAYFGLLNYLNKIFNSLLNRKKFKSTSFIFTRTGFFFSFKENKKNTP